MKLDRYSDALACLPLESVVIDDFFSYTDTQLWTKSLTGTAAVAMAAGVGGILQFTTGATANSPAVVALTNATFKMQAGGAIYAEFLAQYTEANTNNAYIAFGISSVVSSSLLTSATGVPVNSFSGALLYKPVGTTQWSCISSNGTTQNITAGSPTTTGATGGSGGNGYRRYRIEWHDVDGSNTEVTYFIDNQPVLDTTAFHRPIKQTITEASAAAMKPVIYFANASTTGETLNLDYAAAMQRRF